MLPQFMLDQLLSEVSLKATTSGGKGGQNVNKVATRVELFFDVDRSSVLTGEQKSLIRQKLKNRISGLGLLRITASEKRTQLENRELVKQKFAQLLIKALTTQTPRKKSIPSFESKEERLRKKKLLKDKKLLRKDPGSSRSDD